MPFDIDEVLIERARKRATGGDVHDVAVLIGKYRNAADFGATYERALWHYSHSQMTLREALAKATRKEQ